MAKSDDRNDTELIDSLPAFYVDTFSLVWRSDRMRIVFGEYLHQKAHHRTAIAMPLVDAEALANSILEALEEQKKKPS